MKRILTAAIVCCALFQTWAAESQWQTDLTKAMETAKSEKKMVLIDFTGSDWCGWCIKFKKEVFATPEFNNYAKKSLVLVELDYPHQKPQTAELKKVNKQLQAKYKVTGFPTLVVLNSSGKEVGRQEGYEAGGPSAFIAKLEGFKK